MSDDSETVALGPADSPSRTDVRPPHRLQAEQVVSYEESSAIQSCLWAVIRHTESTKMNSPSSRLSATIEYTVVRTW